MINAYRAETGRAALGSDATLRKAAAWLSADSARRGFTPLDHIDSLGRSLAPRLLDCADTMFSAASENVHQGPGDLGSSAGAFRGWTQSAPHNAAMLHAQYTFASVARVSG